jgi:hypothetical protein
VFSEWLRYLRLLLGIRPKITNRPGSDFIITLTTTAERLSSIIPSIYSLLDQSILPRKIILYIPKNLLREGKQLQVKLKPFDPVFTIQYVEIDQGPATKWCYAAASDQFEKGQRFVTVDDDQIYPNGLLEHYQKCLKSESEAVIGLNGWKVPFSRMHKDRKQLVAARVRMWRNPVKVLAPEKVDCVQGTSSYCWAKGMIGSIGELLEKHKPALSADDIFLGGILHQREVNKYVFPAPFYVARLENLWMKKTRSLKGSVNSDDQHNNYLYRLFWDQNT